MPSIRHLAAGALAIAAAALLPASASAQVPAVACPSTFTVLHDDRIGTFELPAGPYEISVLDASSLSCAEAADLFRQFLEDWDGRLPGRWTLDAATATFTDGADGTRGFRVARTSSHRGGGGHHPAGGTACPAPFTVEHDDFIGGFAIPQGQYRITLLAVGRLGCARAARLFARFLQDFDGVLPGRWLLDPETATFMRGARNVGFRIAPWSGVVPPNGGGGTSTRRCPGTFRVLGDDRIGRLALPRGRYVIKLLRGSRLSCTRASALLARFLDRPDGDLPGGWRVRPATATFRRGSDGFRVKPVRPRVS